MSFAYEKLIVYNTDTFSIEESEIFKSKEIIIIIYNVGELLAESGTKKTLKGVGKYS